MIIDEIGNGGLTKQKVKTKGVRMDPQVHGVLLSTQSELELSDVMRYKEQNEFLKNSRDAITAIGKDCVTLLLTYVKAGDMKDEIIEEITKKMHPTVHIETKGWRGLCKTT